MTKSLGRVWAVARTTFLDILRQRILYSLLLFVLVMLVAALVGEQLSIRQQGKILKDMGLAAIEVFGTLLAAFLGVELVSREVERRSLYVLFSRPLSRPEFLFGKFVGLGLALACTVASMTAVMYASLALSRVALDPGLLRAVYGTYLGLLVVVSIALLSSTLTSATIATICTFSLIVAGRYSDVIHNMQQVGPTVPQWFTNALYYALPNFRNFDLKDRVVYGDPIAMGVFGELTLYALAYVLVLLCVAVTVFQRRDLQ